MEGVPVLHLEFPLCVFSTAFFLFGFHIVCFFLQDFFHL